MICDIVIQSSTLFIYLHVFREKNQPLRIGQSYKGHAFPTGKNLAIALLLAFTNFATVVFSIRHMCYIYILTVLSYSSKRVRTISR